MLVSDPISRWCPAAAAATTGYREARASATSAVGRAARIEWQESEAASRRKSGGRDGNGCVPKLGDGNETAAALGARRGALDSRAKEEALAAADDVAGEAAISP